MTRAEIAKVKHLALQGRDLILQHTNTPPLDRRRISERQWVFNLAWACLGRSGVKVLDMKTCAYYASRERKIVISQRLLDEGDVEFTVCHELGHHTWRVLMSGSWLYPHEERFANYFATALLRRDAWDFDSTPRRYFAATA